MMSLNCDNVHYGQSASYAEAVAGDSSYCWNNDTEDFWSDNRSSSSSSPISVSASPPAAAAAGAKKSLLLQHQQREGADGSSDNGHRFPWKDDTAATAVETAGKSALKERNWRRNARPGAYKHVPHKDKPPQVVARRNARERRRVQAVNSAFIRLRRAVPIENTRGKRVSKVKTLQNAIDYINGLKKLLEEDSHYHSLNIYSNYRYANNAFTFLEDLQDFQDEI